MSKQKVAYICSPYRGDIENNVAYAQKLVKHALQLGYAPICPHLYLTQVLDDNNPQEREQGLRAGLELLSVCDVIIVGSTYGISEGMLAEMKQADRQEKKFIEVYKI